MLNRSEYVALANLYCNNVLEMLVFPEAGWEDRCPQEERDKWMMVHANGLPIFNIFAHPNIKHFDPVWQKHLVLSLLIDLKGSDREAQLGHAVKVHQI